MPELTSLHVYPVKSCRGISVNEWTFGPDGLTHDREFLVTDDAGGFLTQRTEPALARIETALSEDALILRSAGQDDFHVPLKLPKIGDSAHQRTVTIWHDSVQALDAGDAVSQWLTQAIGRPTRLVRRGLSYQRFLPAKRIPAHIAPVVTHVPVSFADAFPVLIISEESLADLNYRLDDPLPMNRFRPNFVVRGCTEPYAEDTWATFRIGSDAVFHSGGACVRCIMTTTDQESGERRGKEPLRTLAQYHRDPVDGSGVIFGQNVIPKGSGKLRVGDPVEIMAPLAPATF